ncbi:hypothetical protein ACQPYK_28270 [Streptosporangium sp. CA-135522]|uniref:hypothetical protein n=1 Tax=Streptosporangium sp. CA-135522 TaxID=3240072 RepID=UPI003D8E186C
MSHAEGHLASTEIRTRAEWHADHFDPTRTGGDRKIGGVVTTANRAGGDKGLVTLAVSRS